MAAKKKSGGWIWWLVLLLIAGGLGVWWFVSKKNDDSAPDLKTVSVSKGDITQSVTANGPLSSVKNVTVGSQVSGIITDIRVDFNSRVTNGQVIAQIDPSTYEQNITQSEAELSNAKASLELAELNMKRAEQLKTNDLISASEYDSTLVQLHQAQAVVRLREASLKKTKVDLERTTIYSPIDGVVISRVVDVGQTVAASFNAPTLFSIANDLRNMRIEAMISEADIGGIEEGQPVTFKVEAFPERQFRGRVSQVRYAPVTNQNVVSYTCIVEVNNDDLKLRPGMTAMASVITAQKKDVLRIPNGALRFRPPENVIVTGATNAPAPREGGSTNRVRGDGNLASGDGPQRGNREEMRRRFENMSPEERDQMRQRMRERFGGDGPPGGSREGGSRRQQEGPVTRTIYLLEKDAAANQGKPIVKAVTVKTGISDGVTTEVIEGLNEGDVVVTGLNVVAGANTAANTRPGGSPFGGPFGGGGGMRGR